jgi:hypothetical protein
VIGLVDVDFGEMVCLCGEEDPCGDVEEELRAGEEAADEEGAADRAVFPAVLVCDAGTYTGEDSALLGAGDVEHGFDFLGVAACEFQLSRYIVWE